MIKTCLIIKLTNDFLHFAFVEIKAQEKLPAVKRSRFRAVEVKLVVLYLLILAGITTRCEDFYYHAHDTLPC